MDQIIRMNHLARQLSPTLKQISHGSGSIDPVLKLADFGFARALPEQDMVRASAQTCLSSPYDGIILDIHVEPCGYNMYGNADVNAIWIEWLNGMSSVMFLNAR